MRQITVVFLICFTSFTTIFSQILPDLGCSNLDITQSVLDTMGCDTSTLTSEGDPYIYSGECNIGVRRYMSRNMELNGLLEFNHFKSGCASSNCSPPYDSCEGVYCPEKYAQMIKSLTDLNIQLVSRANLGSFGHEHQFFPEQPYMCQMKKLVQDINYAYDCEGLQRPIIQGMVYESADYDNFDDIPGQHVPVSEPKTIPTSIIEKYFEYYPEDSADTDVFNYYFDIVGMDTIPDDSLFFTKDRVSTVTDKRNYDISKVEMRMWFLYQAFVQIDLGYTAIHMGVYFAYSRADTNNVHMNDSAYLKLRKLTKTIRQYADSQGTFVLLSGEAEMNKPSPKVGDTDTLIFDFDYRALRPREISTPQVSGLDNGCSDPIDSQVLSDFNSSPCSSETLPAILDDCVVNAFGLQTGGISPLGCYFNQVPYIIHFDGFSPPMSPDTASDGALTWGYNDHRWFEMLDDDCKEWFIDYFYCGSGLTSDGAGYLTIPGIILSNYPDDTLQNDKKWLLSDDKDIMQSLQGTLAPDTPTIIITHECLPTLALPCEEVCNNVTAPRGMSYQQEVKRYKIEVGNKDCSSTYSIHIRDSNGNWFPQTIGSETYFIPPYDDDFEIGIRQDNLGYLPGFDVLNVTDTISMEAVCCNLVDESECEDKSPNPIGPTLVIDENLNSVHSRGEDSQPFAVFPNPTFDKIHIQLYGNERELEILLIDVNGAVLNTKNVNGDYFLMQTKDISSGTYVIVLKDAANKEIIGLNRFVKL